LTKIRLIIKLGRIKFLLFGFLCFTAGALLAVLITTPFSWDRFLWGYAVLFLAHLSIHYSNDYWDYETDHFNLPTRFTGGSGILIENPELRPFAKRFAILLITLSLLLALLFSFIYSSTTFMLIVIIGNILAWYYSAPPLKFSYRGLGEISTILSGFLLPALGYVAITGFLDLKILLFSLPFMIFMIFFILSVEIPDMEGDKKGGKNTFIVKNGRKIGFILIGLSGIIGTLSLLGLSLSGVYPTINFQIPVIMSLIPTTVGLYALFRRTSKKYAATKLVNLTVPSLVVFITLLDFYFTLVIMGFLSL
jgi:1,4-dihydroxy-2-naphthoate polyprenyltransferase